MCDRLRISTSELWKEALCDARAVYVFVRVQKSGINCMDASDTWLGGRVSGRCTGDQ